MWSLNKERRGWLRLHSMPAKQLLWAKNTLTQRAIGPVSYTSVKLDASRLKVGDEAGLGAINTPYASLGVVKTDKGLNLRCYDQNTNKEVLKPLAKSKVVWLRLWGDYDKSQLQSFPYLYPPQQTSPDFSCPLGYRNYASIHVR